jgi:MYXO-CTERM domain-containing protein
VATLSCGQTIASANNAGGATSTHGVYGCGPSSSSGPEIAYAFSTPVDEVVTIGLTGVGADLDMFVLGSNTCDGSGAVTCSTNPDASEEWVSFPAAAGAVYTVVVDGWSGAVSGFNLTAQCVGAPPDPVDTGEATPQDTAETDVPDDPTSGGGNPAEHARVPGDAVTLDQVGCGCASTSAGRPGPALAVSLAALLLARARRRSG